MASVFLGFPGVAPVFDFGDFFDWVDWCAVGDCGSALAGRTGRGDKSLLAGWLVALALLSSPAAFCCGLVCGVVCRSAPLMALWGVGGRVWGSGALLGLLGALWWPLLAPGARVWRSAGLEGRCGGII